MLLPWTRRKPRPGPVVSARRPDPPKRMAGRSRLLILIGVVASLFAAGEAYLGLMGGRRLPGGTTVWEIPVLRHADGVYAVGYGSDLAFYGPSGKVVGLPDGADDAVVSDEKVYVAAGDLIIGYGPDGRLLFSVERLPGERLMPCGGLKGILALRPEGSGFGRPWVLRAILDTGGSSPPVRVPGLPAEGAVYGSLIFVGVRDIAAGGESFLVCADIETGEVLWSMSVGQGHFRCVIPLPGGKVFYATSEGAGMAASGRVVRSFRVAGPVWAAAWTDGRAAVSHGAEKNPFVTAFSEDGEELWSGRLPSPAHRLVPSGDRLVALCKTHVVGFSLRDGRREYSFKILDLPLAVEGNLVLFSRGGGAYLLSLDEALADLP